MRKIINANLDRGVGEERGGKVVKISVRIHPEVLFAYSSNRIEVIIRVENPASAQVWVEADVAVPEGLSLSPIKELRKGRVRMGILGKKEFLEKSVRVYGNSLTSPQIYRSNIAIYEFNRNGIIEKRMEKPFDVRCEPKKEASL